MKKQFTFEHHLHASGSVWLIHIISCLWKIELSTKLKESCFKFQENNGNCKD